MVWDGCIVVKITELIYLKNVCFGALNKRQADLTNFLIELACRLEHSDTINETDGQYNTDGYKNRHRQPDREIDRQTD